MCQSPNKKQLMIFQKKDNLIHGKGENPHQRVIELQSHTIGVFFKHVVCVCTHKQVINQASDTF